MQYEDPNICTVLCQFNKTTNEIQRTSQMNYFNPIWFVPFWFSAQVKKITSIKVTDIGLIYMRVMSLKSLNH